MDDCWIDKAVLERMCAPPFCIENKAVLKRIHIIPFYSDCTDLCEKIKLNDETVKVEVVDDDYPGMASVD